VRVDVAVEHVIQGARPAAGEREAAQRREREPGGGQAARAHDHAAGARDEEEHHDPRLGERDVVAPRAGRHRGPTAEGERGRHRRRGEGACAERDVEPARRLDERGVPGEREEEERGACRAQEVAAVRVREPRRQDRGREERERDVGRDVVGEPPLPRRHDGRGTGGRRHGRQP
jgi:hypothetical protein